MKMNNWVEQVAEFHEIYGLPIVEKPTLAPEDRYLLRYALIFEELCEFADAVKDEDIVEVADSLGDLIYVIVGAALEYGIPLDEVVSEIHRSNLSKLDEDGKPIYNEMGKVMKGKNYSPPDLKGILGL